MIAICGRRGPEACGFGRHPAPSAGGSPGAARQGESIQSAIEHRKSGRADTSRRPRLPSADHGQVGTGRLELSMSSSRYDTVGGGFRSRRQVTVSSGTSSSRMARPRRTFQLLQHMQKSHRRGSRGESLRHHGPGPSGRDVSSSGRVMLDLVRRPARPLCAARRTRGARGSVFAVVAARSCRQAMISDRHLSRDPAKAGLEQLGSRAATALMADAAVER